MSDAPLSLPHSDMPAAEDAVFAEECRSHVAANPALQLIAELILKLRGSRFSWWTPEFLRGTWSANERMGWFERRPDIRQRVTCSLTGLRPKASRNKQPDFQAALIDSVIDDGDVTVGEFESAFDAIEVAAYAPVAEIWQRFRERMPWDQDTRPNQELVGWLFDRLLASSSSIEGMTRKPILTSHAIRTAIRGEIWHSKIPLEIRVAIDDLRFEREQSKPGEPFHAIHDLSVATPAIIAANIPLRELLRVVETAESAMGLRSPVALTARAAPPKAEESSKPEPVAAEAKPEPPKESVKVRPVESIAEKIPEKPAEKPAEKPVERWERMWDKVLEKVGKEGGGTEESAGITRSALPFGPRADTDKKD